MKETVTKEEEFFLESGSEIRVVLQKFFETDEDDYKYGKTRIKFELNNVIEGQAWAAIALEYVPPQELKRFGMWLIENADKIDWSEEEIEVLQKK